MLDIKFVRENPEIVKQNIRNKFQDNKLELVDKVIELDKENREIKQEVEALRAERNKTSKQIGALMAQGKRDEAEEVKKQVAASGARIDELSAREKEVEEELLKNMMVIPNIIDPSVPIGKDDSENVEIEKFGEPVVPDFEVPYHTDIMESFDGIDLDSARRVAGNGFYYLMGDIARLHSAVIAYARDFMLNRGFTYCVPPFMIRSNVVTGVMSFAEMDAMMYKIEGEDLYLIGTSEHSMIGKFIDQIVPEEELPKTLTSYSPCFRKEKGAHGLEESAEYNRQSGKCLISRPDNMEQISAWRSNSLNFYLTPLNEIIKVMERHYDVHFIVKDSTVLKNRFTLSTGKVNASDVLYDLETVSNICFTEVEDGLFEVGTK